MIDFAKVQRSVKALKQQLANNQLDEKSFENQLLELIDIAEDGYYWMYGHQSNQWFRHDGEKWIPDDPSRIPAAGAAGEEGVQPEESPLSMAWFVVSLALLVLIGWIVYVSSLI